MTVHGTPRAVGVAQVPPGQAPAQPGDPADTSAEEPGGQAAARPAEQPTHSSPEGSAPQSPPEGSAPQRDDWSSWPPTAKQVFPALPTTPTQANPSLAAARTPEQSAVPPSPASPSQEQPSPPAAPTQHHPIVASPVATSPPPSGAAAETASDQSAQGAAAVPAAPAIPARGAARVAAPAGADSPAAAVPAEPAGAAHVAVDSEVVEEPAEPLEPVERAEPVRLTRPTPRGRVGPVSPGQLVAVQLAALTAALTYPQPDFVFIPTLLAGAGVATGALVRRGDRWWYEELAARARLRQRQRPAGQQLHAVTEVTSRESRIGIGVDEDGWFAVLDLSRARQPDRLPEVLARLTAPVSAVQLVHHVTAAADGGTGRRTWIALRLDRGDALAEAERRGGGVEGVHRALAAAVSRVGKALRDERIPFRTTDAAALRHAVGTVCSDEGSDGPARGESAPEQWRGWHGSDGVQVSFELTGECVLSTLVERLRRGSARSFTVSVRMPVRDGGSAGTTGDGEAAPARYGLLRVTTDVADTAADLATQVRGTGLSARRLDGWHGPARYAAAPTGRAWR